MRARAKSIDREAPVIGVDNENFVDLRVEEMQVVNDGEVLVQIVDSVYVHKENINLAGLNRTQ